MTIFSHGGGGGLMRGQRDGGGAMTGFWIKLFACLSFADATVLIQDGHAVAKRGAAPFILLAELAELARTNGIETACIHARMTGHGFSLTLFGVPQALHQRFRNVWAANWR